MASPHDIDPEERYEIRSKIGEGGIGAVYLAYDRTLKREVAIKRLLPQGDKPEEERHHAEEIVREAGALSKLQHPNIVTVYDAGIDDDGGFVVMEFIDGETVDQTLSRGALTYEDFREVVEQALEGLIAAQDIDMLHRDLKPSNVMIRWLPSGKFQLKLLDFGLARVTQKPALQTVRHGDSILGSIYFMAPEQFEREPLDGRTDLYSLGCLFYYMLAGTYPFDGEGGADVMVKKLEHEVAHLSTVRPDIPKTICDWVMRMLSRQAHDRPANAQIALAEFDAAALQAEEQLAAENRNPLLAPALARTSPPAAPQVATGHIVGSVAITPGAPPLHTTSFYMQRPSGAKKNYTGLALGAAATVMLTFGLGGWLLFGQKLAKPKTNDYEQAYNVEEEDDVEVAPPESEPVAAPPAIKERSVAITKAEWPAELKPLIPLDAVWKYWDQGGVPDNTWRLVEFADNDWPEGSAPIGYGEKDGSISTEIGFGENSKNKHACALFRHTFTYPENSNFETCWLRFQVDDACVVYLNGVEIARVGMGSKPWPGPNQFADRKAHSPKDEETFFHFRMDDLRKLKRGDNTLAVRVHQISKTSSDMRLQLEFGGEE